MVAGVFGVLRHCVAPLLHLIAHVCCREVFDRLTEYSSLLLQHGDYSIHSTSREELVAQTDAAMAAQLQAVMGVLSTSCTSSVSDTSAQTSDTCNRSATFSGSAPLFASRRPCPHDQGVLGSCEEKASHSMDTDAPAPSKVALAGFSVTEEAANETAVEQALPADPEEDIFAGAEAQQHQSPVVHHSGTQPFNSEPDENQGDRLQNESAMSVSTLDMSASQNTCSANGFVYDDSSGTWFNADLGYFYDATHGLYGDASSGKWYSYVDGMYQLVC